MGQRMSTSPLGETWWYGSVSRLAQSQTSTQVVAVLHQTQSGAQAFKAALSDGSVAWVKAMGNGQGSLCLVTELVVARLAAALDVCARPSRIVEVPPALHRHMLPGAGYMKVGPAHASEPLDYAEEIESFVYRTHDHNCIREVGIYGLWDLCLGQDAQWLSDPLDDRSIWSHDHSLWLAMSASDWDAPMLRKLVDTPWTVDETDHPLDGLSADAFHQLAGRFRTLDEKTILDIMNDIPTAWCDDDRLLEVLGWFLFRRSKAVAQRLVESGHKLDLI